MITQVTEIAVLGAGEESWRSLDLQVTSLASGAETDLVWTEIKQKVIEYDTLYSSLASHACTDSCIHTDICAYTINIFSTLICYTYIHMYRHTCTHIHVHTHAHTMHTRAQSYAYLHVHIHSCTYSCTYSAHISNGTCGHIHIHLNIHTYTHVYTCIKSDVHKCTCTLYESKNM